MDHPICPSDEAQIRCKAGPPITSHRSTRGILNPKNSDARWKLKESLREFPTKTWSKGRGRTVQGSAKGSGLPRLSKYNFNIILSDLVSTLKDIKEARFPKDIYSNPDRRNMDLWCEYHNTTSILPRITTIRGLRSHDYLGPGTWGNSSVIGPRTTSIRIRGKMDEECPEHDLITFANDDCNSLAFPHNEALLGDKDDHPGSKKENVTFLHPSSSDLPRLKMPFEEGSSYNSKIVRSLTSRNRPF
ncbi:hypothetical protein HAX54_025813 [Datura stramonium]|uniref:Uncharacterized protein n=1 Tax=Datura stramonium TaxID=4076 RepID=A0ABS8V1S2_DATST|nr:hypothetical protein [Datura stramonium]